MDPSRGAIVGGRFEVETLAAAGAFGRVFRARDRETNEPVALKIFPAALDYDEARFLREARILEHIEHPRVVRYVSHGVDLGRVYLAMEWVEGVSLEARLGRDRLGLREAVQLVAALAEALAAIHREGVVHRDFKPANVILEGGDLMRPRVLDLGFARLEGASNLTVTGQLIGTPSYMAPEQVTGEVKVDARADLWALGCVLFECVTGEVAYSGTNARNVLLRLLDEPPPRLATSRPVPEPLEALLGKLLEKDRGKRADDAEEIRNELLRIADALDERAAGSMPAQRAALPAPLPTPARARPTPASHRETAAAAAAIEQDRRAMLRAAKVALFAWPSFVLLDLYMSTLLYEQASFARFAVYRLAGELALVVSLLVTRNPGVRPVWARLAHVLSYALMAWLIGLMSLELGGLHSRYVHGVSIVVMVRAIMVPAPYPRSFAWSLPILVSFPAVHFVATWLTGTLGVVFAPHELAVFASDYIFLFGSTVVGTASGHVLWAAEQRLYRARRLGRYRLEAPIGRGGMGEIWLAWDDALRRKVALKILRTASGDDTTAVARFEREAHAASTLRDAHTIRIFDFGASDDGIRFIAMEYLPGADLAALVADHGAMPPARAVRIVRQACSSLAEAHDAGITHRDIKPQNLFVTQVESDFDFVKLLDFGIARVAREGEGDESLTRTGALPGTPGYMAPELLRGAEADARSDLYGLGATLYHLLTTSTPWTASERGELRPAGAVRGEPLPEALEQVLTRCLQKRPEDRFQSARELQAALAACELPAWTDDDARRFWLVTRPDHLARR